MNLKPKNQTLREINDSKIIAIDYYSHERNCLNGLKNVVC
jgi:hypothetical protein